MLLLNVDSKNCKIKFVDFMSSLTIRPEKLSEKNDLKAIAIEDHMNDDLSDLYFGFRRNFIDNLFRQKYSSTTDP